MEINCAGCPESVELEPWSASVLHERANAAQTILDRMVFARFEITFPQFCKTAALGRRAGDLFASLKDDKERFGYTQPVSYTFGGVRGKWPLL